MRGAAAAIRVKALTELIFATKTLFVAVLGSNGLIERANAGLTGSAGRDVTGTDLSELIVPVHRVRFRAWLQRANGDVARFSYAPHATDVPLDVLVRVASDARRRVVVLEADIENDLRAANHLFELAEGLTEARRRLNALAETDSLTGVFNRRGLDRALAPLASSGRPLTAAMIDVDHFKAVNDRFGHADGDRVLKRISDVLRATVRRTDVVARYGGEEFVVILSDSPLDVGLAWAERARTAIEAAEVDDGGIRVTASVGVAQRRDGESFDDLLARADSALYEAKTDGRNRVRASV